ncbi:MAG: hypothetical protein OZ921_17660 [Sorangiineae bacterium]|nr:hypothetical protein [Sorangiineae bacterium]
MSSNSNRPTPLPDSIPPMTDAIDASWDDDPPLEARRSARELPTAPAPRGPRGFDPSGAPAREGGEGSLRSTRPEGIHRPAFDSLPELPSAPPPPLVSRGGALALGEETLPTHGARREERAPGTPAPRSLEPRLPSTERPGRAAVRGQDDLVLDLDDRPTPVVSEEVELPELELDLADERAASADEPTRDMKDRYAMGDFTGALVVAESLLEVAPGHPEALRYAESCREVLTQMYAARLGELTQIPSVATPNDEIRWLSLDHRAGFLLSLIDGASSVEEILDISGMSRLDALRIMFTLLEQRVIALEPDP